MANITDAWLLPISNNRHCAVSEHVIVEYVISPQLVSVPLTPKHCCFILNWREKFVPVLNLGMFLDWSNSNSVHHVAIVAYQHEPRMPLNYGAIMLSDSPSKISVDDRQACELPSYIDAALLPMVLSCFSLNEEKVPIFDMSYLLSQRLGKLALSTGNAVLYQNVG